MQSLIKSHKHGNTYMRALTYKTGIKENRPDLTQKRDRDRKGQESIVLVEV